MLDNEAKFHGAKGLFVALLFDPQVPWWCIFISFDNRSALASCRDEFTEVFYSSEAHPDIFLVGYQKIFQWITIPSGLSASRALRPPPKWPPRSLNLSKYLERKAHTHCY